MTDDQNWEGVDITGLIFHWNDAVHYCCGYQYSRDPPRCRWSWNRPPVVDGDY